MKINKNICDAMPHLTIHGDYHPGNLKFQDGKVIIDCSMDVLLQAYKNVEPCNIVV